MTAILVGMVAETFVHSGVGQVMGGIDLPVARERTTDYAFMPGSGVKGGYKTWAKEQLGFNDAKCNALFGQADDAGKILFSDARLLLLPVRSLNTAYVWLTCPLLLERLARDIARIGAAAGFDPAKITVGTGTYLAPVLSGSLALEEREFTKPNPGDIPASEKPGLLGAIKKLMPSVMQSRLERQLAIISDEDFAWFAKYALPVSAHNQLEEKTKKSKQLWHEETLPPDTVMYSILTERKDGAGNLADIVTALQGPDTKKHYAQFGGNETVGHGWFHLKVAFSAPPPVHAQGAQTKTQATEGRS